MIQRFIELGEGYSDLYELILLAKANQNRLVHMLQFNTTINKKDVCSLAIVLQPTPVGSFQPLYICREGIPISKDKTNKRLELFSDVAKELNKEIVQFTVKPSQTFAEKELFYNHLIGILRMNRFIPPMQ
ncbi:methylthioribose kinase [Ectobacillus polymachus]|uniref:DUF7147 family protein n=1 Tax=Ectobacillus polymachus TaxID=1508806 RepID=UPI003A85A93F